MDEKGVSAQKEDMKPIYLQLAAGLAATFALGAGAACAQQQAPAGSETVTSSTSVAPELADPEHWLDAPQTPGDWSYFAERDETLAIFGVGEGPFDFHFILRCEVATRDVYLARHSLTPQDAVMRIRSETRDRLLNAQPIAEAPQVVAAVVKPNDPLLDAIAITQGRFAVEVEGLDTLYLPAWAEVSRVIEDCR